MPTARLPTVQILGSRTLILEEPSWNLVFGATCQFEVSLPTQLVVHSRFGGTEKPPVAYHKRRQGQNRIDRIGKLFGKKVTG